MTAATLSDKPLLFIPLLKEREQKRALSTAAHWGLLFIMLTLGGWAAGLAIGFSAALTLLTVVALGAVVIGLWHPTIGLLGISMLCTLDAVTRHYLLTGGLLRWNTFNYWLLVVLLLYAVKFLAVRYLPMRLLLAFCALLTLQLLYSPDRYSGLQHWLGIVTSLSLFVYCIRAAKDPGIWPWVGLLTGVLAGVGGFVFNLQRHSLPNINPNALVYFPLTALFAICMAFKFVRGRSAMQLALQLLALVNGGWVFLTGSRGGMLMGLCCLIYLAAASKRLHLFCGMLVLAALVGYGISARFGEAESFSVQRIKKLFSSDVPLAERTSGRSDLVLAGWYMFLKEPWGTGTGGFGVRYADVSGRAFLGYGAGYEKAAHSGWIKTLAENGVVGILLFTAFVGSFAWVGWVRRRTGVFSLGLLVTLVLSTALISTEFQGKAIWFLMAGSMVILYRGYSTAAKPREVTTVTVGPANEQNLS